MKKEKLEKQASSEIAESRFEKWLLRDRLDDFDFTSEIRKGLIAKGISFKDVSWIETEEIVEAAIKPLRDEINRTRTGWQAAERDTRERVGQEQQENVTALIHIAGSVVRREYLPSLERCRTIRDARAEVERYDSRHVDLAMKIKAVAERIRGKD